MLITVDSDRDVDAVCAALPEACQRHQFGVLNTHDLRGTLREKGQEYDRACFVFDVCNPVKAKTVLDAAPHISAALPCRISVYEEGGKARLVTIRPSMLVELFQGKGLAETAYEVEETLKTIMQEAAG